MKNENQADTCSLQKHFDLASGFYELGMLDEAEAELSKIEPCVAAQSVPVLALWLVISQCRADWNKMKIIARRLFEVDSSNPKWAFCDGYATAKIEYTTETEIEKPSRVSA